MRSVALVALVAAAATGVSALTLPCEFITAKNFNDTGIAQTADNQYAAMKAFVTDIATKGTGGTTGGLFNDAATKTFFDGTTKYRKDAPAGTTYTGPYNTTVSFVPGTTGYVASELTGLVGHLAQFFAPVFKCATATTTAYPYSATMSKTQRDFHSGMKITPAVWNAFVAQAAATATTYGLAAASVTGTTTPTNFIPGIANALTQFNRNMLGGTAGANQICNQADCKCATTDAGVALAEGANCDTAVGGKKNSASASSFSFAGLVALAAAALALKQ